MRSSIFFSLATLAATVTAYPLLKRDTTNDIGILNFALTLEHLESTFYKYGLEKFSNYDFEQAGYSSKIRDTFVHIGIHEAQHVTTLTNIITGLEGTPVPECQYKFPLDNVHTFLAVAQALENTGVSAYTGAISDLSIKELITGAATIATVEGRHSTVLNEILGGLAVPYSFDTPLSTREVVTIASNFIESCPFDLGVQPFSQLTVKLPEDGDKDRKVETYFEPEFNGQTWCQFLYNDKVRVSKREECLLPVGAIGYVYIFITDSSVPLTLIDGGASIVAGPALAFVGQH